MSCGHLVPRDSCPQCQSYFAIVEMRMTNKPHCKLCDGEGLVCENHPSIPWNSGNQECCGGAGMSCECVTIKAAPEFDENESLQSQLAELEVLKIQSAAHEENWKLAEADAVAMMKERDKLQTQLTEAQAENSRLKTCKELLSEPLDEADLKEMIRRLESWHYHVSQRDQFREMELERQIDSLKAEVEQSTEHIHQKNTRIADLKSSNKILREGLNKAADYLEHCLQKLKAPEPYMIDEIRNIGQADAVKEGSNDPHL